MFKDIIDKLSLARIIPVAAVEDASKAVSAVGALMAGGITAVEIVFRTTGGQASLAAIARCIEACSKSFPQMTVGAGTVTNAGLAAMAADAGAAFIVSPGYNPSTVNWCIEHAVPIIPGVCTPSQIEVALDAGLDTLKFFPAELTGGVKWLKAMAGPFPAVRFVATGGISENNAASYLAAPNCAAVCSSAIAARDAIAQGDWPLITANAQRAMHIASAC